MKRELAHRSGGGLQITLFWDDADDSLSVFVEDEREGEIFAVPVGDASPLDVFYHPFAHARRSRERLAA
jgi:hypothetical protein